MPNDDTDAFNMSMRKFLKQVGVTSQRAIESHVREAGLTGGTLKLKVVLSDDSGRLHHVVEGDVALG